MKEHFALKEVLAAAPQHWEQRRFRFVVQERNEKNVNSNMPLLSLSAATGIQERDGDGGLGRQAPSDETVAMYGVVHPGDLVINPMWALEGGLASSSLHGAVSPAYRIYRPGSGVDSRYLHHLVRSSPYMEQYKLFIRGITTFDRSITKDDFHDLPILLPPLDEQRRIAHFLDAETARIDAIMAARRAQVAVLDEVELARIGEQMSACSQTTGPVYAYFEVQLSKKLNAATTSGDGQAQYLRNANVHWYEIDISDMATMSFEPAERRFYALGAGDLLVCEGGAGVAEAAVWDCRLTTCFYQMSLHRIRPRKQVPVEWLMYWLRYAKAIGVFNADGKLATIPHLTAEQLAEYRIPIPEDGQRRVGELSAEIAAIRETQRKMEAADALLAGRRQALITAAVTGGITV